MAHWYVDSAATGTGSGDTPANAALNVTSISAALNVNSDVPAMVWVRRTNHINIVDARSMTWGINSINVNSHSMNWIIGWPNSGDPFYEERPAAGVSAGWDSDAANLMFWPTIAVSGGYTPTGIRRGTGVTNFTVITSPLPATPKSIEEVFGTAGESPIGTIGIMYGDMRNGSNRFVDHFVFCTSSDTGNPIAWLDRVRKITFTESCMHGPGLASTGIGALHISGVVGVRVEELINLSNSISVLFSSEFDADPGISFGRIRGTRPYSADAFNSNGSDASAVIVDDYFGLGPAALFTRVSGPSFIASSAGVAVHSGSSAYMSLTRSYALTISIGGHKGFRLFEHVRQLVTVTSGIPLVLRHHFATVDAGSLDQNKGSARFAVPAAGCGDKYLTLASSGIRAGSAGLWTGSLTNVQSYYMMFAEYVPKESALVQIAARLPGQGKVASGSTIYYSPFIEVNSQ